MSSYPAVLSLTRHVLPALHCADVALSPLTGDDTPVTVVHGAVSGFRIRGIGHKGLWPVTISVDTEGLLRDLGYSALPDTGYIEINAKGGEIIVVVDGVESEYTLLDMSDIDVAPSY